MATERKARDRRLMDQLRLKSERRALQEARLIPWKRLVTAAETCTDWQVFALWARAVVDSAQAIPDIVEQEIASRCPQLLDHGRRHVEAAVEGGNSPGLSIWEDVITWADRNVFHIAKSAGWLHAVQHFSAMSLRSMKAWSHWENIDDQWSATPPAQFPTYLHWESDVAAVVRLSNPASDAQRVLDVVGGMPESTWNDLFDRYLDLNAFCAWLELAADMQDQSSAVSNELNSRYRGFTVNPAIPPRQLSRSVEKWGLDDLGVDDHEGTLAALQFQARYHPRYHAPRRYSSYCRRAWAVHLPHRLPHFKDWCSAADAHFET